MNDVYKILKQFALEINEDSECNRNSINFGSSYFKLRFRNMEVIIEAGVMEFDNENLFFVEENICLGIDALSISVKSILTVDIDNLEIHTTECIVKYLGGVY